MFHQKAGIAAKIIAFVNHKGGTGKTTSCISVAGFLAKTGKKVLVVDLDPQGNATSGLGINKNSLDKSAYHVMNKDLVTIKPTLLDTNIENIHIVPANSDLALAKLDPYRIANDALILSRSLKSVKNRYDYILIDTPPSNYPFIVNGVTAANHIVLILDPSIFSLEGIESFNAFLNDASKELELIPNIEMVILTKVQGSFLAFLKKNITSEIKKELERSFNEKLFIVPYSLEKINEAQLKGLPISHSSPKSDVGKAYRKITEEVITW